MLSNLRIVYHFSILALVVLMSQSVYALKTRVEFMTYEVMRHDVDHEHALTMIDSLFTHHKGELTDAQSTMLLRRQLELAMEIGNYSTASSALAQLKERSSDFPSADALQMELDSGICSYYSGEYASAIKSAFSVLSEDKPESLKELDLGAYLLLSNVSNRIGAPDESLSFLNQAQEMIHKIYQDSLRRVYEYRVLLGQSSRSLIMEDYQNAYYYLQKCDSMRMQGVVPYSMENNFAIVYSIEGSDDMAERYYKDIMNAEGIHYNKCVGLNNYADFLLEHNRIDEALRVMDINLPQLKTIDAIHALGIRQLMRFQALAAKGELRPSIESADSALNIMMMLMAQESRRMYSQVYSKFEADKMADEYDSVRHENTRLYIALGILILIALGAVIWIWFAEKQKRNLVAKMEAGRSDLAGFHRDYIARVDQMQEELNLKNRELTKLELRNTQLMSKVDSIVRAPVIEGKDSQKLVENIRTELRNVRQANSDWSAFEVYFKQVQPDFYDNLTRLHPTLTSGERRMCAFIRTGMKTSEIATLCNRSSRTVESIKYRLKKKLEIPEGITLDHYLSTLGSVSNLGND